MSDKNTQSKPDFAFGKENYMILLGGIALIILGFILMSGGGSEDPNVFNGEELFNFRRITLAPITVILGFIVVIVAIMKKPKD